MLNRLVLVLVVFSACAPPAQPPEPWTNVIPRPGSVSPGDGVLVLGEGTTVSTCTAELEPAGALFAETLRRATSWRVPQACDEGATIRLELGGDAAALGDEGYELTVTTSSVAVRAPTPAGVFYGTQTLWQLLPARLERGRSYGLGTGTIRDRPRFAWRGFMLDVVRHWYSPAEVRRYVDVMARYKLNRLHLHLTDDQGWRIAIDAYPALTMVGAATQVGGGPGGFLTKADYADLVAYAQARAITVVPEIDLPGHTHAALASIPELNCDGIAPPAYTGINVGFSSLCASKPLTATFIREVLGEVAAMTPGPYLHVGGDEAKMTSAADYAAMTAVAREAVAASGKQLLAWEEFARADAGTGEVVQHWIDPSLAQAAAGRGAKVILSPVRRAYVDVQYAYDVPPGAGVFWPGYVNVPTAYDWDPGSFLDGVPEASVLGVEAAMWTETVSTVEQLDTLTFPRLLGIAELGWSPSQAGLRDYLTRLGTHGPRLTASGFGFYAAPEVSWAE